MNKNLKYGVKSKKSEEGDGNNNSQKWFVCSADNQNCIEHMRERGEKHQNNHFCQTNSRKQEGIIILLFSN